MKFLFSVLVLATVASVGLQVDGNGLVRLTAKLDKNWQWIDNFVKDGASCDRINEHIEGNQATMEPKMLAAFKLVADVACMSPPKSGCSDSEGMKIVHLLRALRMDNDVKTERSAGVREFATKKRDNYVNTCSDEYLSAMSLSLSDKVDRKVRAVVEDFALSFGELHGLNKKKKVISGKLTGGAGILGNGYLARALFDTVQDSLFDQEKHLDAETGKMEYNYSQLVEGVKADCKMYVDAVKDPLEVIAKDTLVADALELSKHSSEIWKKWTATIACDRLESLDTERAAKGLAAQVHASSF